MLKASQFEGPVSFFFNLFLYVCVFVGWASSSFYTRSRSPREVVLSARQSNGDMKTEDSQNSVAIRHESSQCDIFENAVTCL